MLPSVAKLRLSQTPPFHCHPTYLFIIQQAEPPVTRAVDPPAAEGSDAAPVEIPSAPVEIPSAPVEVSSAPAEVQSAPVEVLSTPAEVSPALVEPSPAPVEVPRAPVEILPVPVKAPSAAIEVPPASVGVLSAPVEVSLVPTSTASASAEESKREEVPELPSVKRILAKLEAAIDTSAASGDNPVPDPDAPAKGQVVEEGIPLPAVTSLVAKLEASAKAAAASDPPAKVHDTEAEGECLRIFVPNLVLQDIVSERFSSVPVYSTTSYGYMNALEKIYRVLKSVAGVV